MEPLRLQKYESSGYLKTTFGEGVGVVLTTPKVSGCWVWIGRRVLLASPAPRGRNPAVVYLEMWMQYVTCPRAATEQYHISCTQWKKSRKTIRNRRSK